MSKKVYHLSTQEYEKKLARIMQRLGVKEDQYNYDWTRHTAYVQFFYKGNWYQFDHSVDKANATGKVKLIYGTDVFAQLVLALEDLARMSERGIYDLTVWISGMRYLPEMKDIPQCFKNMGFAGPETPNEQDLKARYKNLLKKKHPDNGGSEEEFNTLQNDMKACLDYLFQK